MAKKVSTAKQPDVLSTAPYDKADATAMRAVASGTANPEQQVRVFNWIMYQACNLNGLPYYPGDTGDRDTAFANGQRFVALQINALLNDK